MPKVTWKTADREIVADVAVGDTLMNAALDADVPTIYGECGGCLACATCHVFVDEAWREKTGEPDPTEEAMLDVTDIPKQDNSRLSCQITMSAELDGLVLHIPE